MKLTSSTLYSLSKFFDDAAAIFLLASPVWLAGTGIAAGVMAAPVLGVGAVAAAVVGGVAGFCGGAMTWLGMAGHFGSGNLQPALLVALPVEALGSKLRTMALTREISPADRMRLKDAFTKAVIPSSEASKKLRSGGLYADAALTVRNRGETIDSIVSQIENKTFPGYRNMYKP